MLQVLFHSASFTIVGNTLAYALSALQEAMSYGFGWDNLSNEFVMKVVSFVDNSNLNVSRYFIFLFYLSNWKLGVL